MGDCYVMDLRAPPSQFRAEVIHRRGPCRSSKAVAFATLEWVDWFNTRNLLALIGSVPPAETETRDDSQVEVQALAAWLKPNRLREIRGGSRCRPHRSDRQLLVVSPESN